LGGIYDYGLGVPRDFGEAKEWYRKAAEQGHEEARLRLRWLGVRRAIVTGPLLEVLAWMLFAGLVLLFLAFLRYVL
ncbi:MAG TPA: hypothetical protein VLC48_01700, partial [Gemmatimonadota bacterium]|nr:hypothetical protein [Gemmatimonadota bacterium]